MWLLLWVLCFQSSVIANDPTHSQRFTHGAYEAWKRDAHESIEEFRNRKVADESPSREQDAASPLQCLPVQRYRSRYLEGAPDRDIAVCKMLIFTHTQAPHLEEALSDEELFHCGHCALRGGLLVTGAHYLRQARVQNKLSAAAAINYGVALQLTGDTEGAIKEYKHALLLEPGNEAAAKNLVWSYTVSDGSVERAREMALIAYEKSWVRLVVHIAGKRHPTKFFHEQIFNVIGVFPKNQTKVSVRTPPILGTEWELELQQLPGEKDVSRLIIQKPVLKTPETGYAGLGTNSLNTDQAFSSSLGLMKNITAPSSLRTLNMYDFGLNRDLCLDPAMSAEPPQKESTLALMLNPRASKSVIGRVGRRYLATVKRALVGLMDRSHTPETVLSWAGGDNLNETSLGNHATATMSLSLATLNRLNHSHYLDPPFPGMVLGTIGMMNHVQMCLEDVLQAGVPGAVLEAGVWRGGEAILMRAALEAAGDTDRSVYLLDTFSGIPEPRDKTATAEHDESVGWQPGQYQASRKAVMANFARFDLLDDRVHFVEGNFHDTLPTFASPKLAILRLDADTYEATAVLLDHLYQHVSLGGSMQLTQSSGCDCRYIIIDDFHLNGARRAVTEFRQRHGITDSILPVPEDYVFACGQLNPNSFHTWPKKMPQGAYWKKGGFRSVGHKPPPGQ